MQHLYYDIDGTPLADLKTFLAARGHTDSQVARTMVGDNVEVSTIWLGINHNYFGHGEPLIFETMIFGKSLDGGRDQWRYSTREQALAGHDEIVNRLRAEGVAG
ncbi:hypothetical protein [Hoyosella altamirensis]|uniref:hypothetical protein n=1 Tax=Hoyosella altamirensis TaxID=616997 RepID=UPI0007DB315E|nr:hypothetical protein [Hoyosella altamirensis]